MERSSEYVQSLERGLRVIETFGAESGRQTLSEVAQRAGMPRAAARRFLFTLQALGYVRSDGKFFELTSNVLRLGYAYLSSATLPDLVAPHLERLAAELGESCSVAVLEGAEIVYVARVQVSRIMAVTIAVGTRFPADRTSLGKVLLAGTRAPGELEPELREVREQGWAIVDQELEPGLRSVAAPLIDSNGAVVAAINVSTHTSRVSKHELRKAHLPALLRTAAAINDQLSHL